jgi:hypothetical protein
MEEQMSDLLKLGGLWKNQTKDGEMMLSGSLGYNINIKIFKNGYKDKENDPDYILYLAPKPKKEEGGGYKKDQDDDIGF